MSVFFVINQSLLDGSAHALFCYRRCWWLAKSRSGVGVHLIFPGKADSASLAARFGLPQLPNLVVRGLPAVRRQRGRRGLTLNIVFYTAALVYLLRHSKHGDVVASASFPKLVRFLTAIPAMAVRWHMLYEVHQLALLDDGSLTPRARAEFAALARVNAFTATTQMLQQTLREQLPGRPSAIVGLACSHASAPPPRIRVAGAAYVLGYLGSLYAGQGVDWLVKNWAQIAMAQPQKVTLRIVGGSEQDVEKLRPLISNRSDIEILSAVPPSQVEEQLQQMDALVIPCLNQGRMPFVAITKAYDYLALGRPVLASNLPSIVEVMRDSECHVFKAGDVASLSAALTSVLLSPEAAAARVSAALLRAKEFSWSTQSERWWRFVESEFSPSAGRSTSP